MTADITLQWTTRVDGKRSEATSTEPPPVLSFSHAKSDPQSDAHPLQSALSWAIAMRAKPIRGGRAGSRNTLQTLNSESVPPITAPLLTPVPKYTRCVDFMCMFD